METWIGDIAKYLRLMIIYCKQFRIGDKELVILEERNHDKVMPVQSRSCNQGDCRFPPQ